MRRLWGGICLWLLFSVVGNQNAWAGPPVAPTEALTPAEQQKKFKLPPGFEIQLVASEPDIQKPMNLAFDARGRLWVTHSIEYPFAVPEGQTPRDGVTVLSEFALDGRAARATRFAEKLHIPIGVVPLGAGNEAIVWSIPYLWKLRDLDGDGREDEREILYGPFDYVDTHGNQNALRLGADGWIYACHGFRNDSKIKLRGQGDVVLQMQSGNTYRFRPDGSAIEQLTWGQVNPFGMCFDRWGNRFSADCHSKPVTMLLRGAHYESFGKPHDGLGFAPPMTAHGHDSTGLAGVAYYDATQYPAEYRHSLFIGNVVTNVVHRDVVEWRGSSPWVTAPQDFVVCDDPWFHPVDLQVGPDGALYIADFYNSIIGHYEVDLRHPRRDRTRGRIWRVVWKGTPNSPAAPAAPVPDLTRLSAEQLLAWTEHENMTLRSLATQQLIERGADAARHALESQKLSTLQESAAVWVAFRYGGLTELIARQSTSPMSAVGRVQLLHALAEQTNASSSSLVWARSQLEDSEPQVRRAAADALGQHPHADNIESLLKAGKETAPQDTHLAHMLRLAMRKQLRAEGGIAVLARNSSRLDAGELKSFLEIALASPTPEAADFVFGFLREHEPNSELLERSATQVARWSAPPQWNAVAEFSRKQFATDFGRQAGLLRATLDGLRQRSEPIPGPRSPLGQWALDVAGRLLDAKRPIDLPWTNVPLEAAASARPSASPWGIRTRRCADGQEVGVFDSIVQGEQLTGVLRSAPFEIPAQFSFWMCGHNGLPGTTPPPVNHIRLRLVESGETIAKEIPPRDDTARQYTWDLKMWAGRRGFLEVVDADTGASYAWIGVGRFAPPVVAQPSAAVLNSSSLQETALQLAVAFQLTELTPEAIRLLDDVAQSPAVRVAASQAVFALERNEVVPRATRLVASAAEPLTLRGKAAELLAAVNSAETRATLATALATAPGALQQQIALNLASTPDGAETLLATIAAGKASARMLQEKPILDRLQGVAVPDKEKRIEQLTKGLPAADEKLRQALTQRLAGFGATSPSLEQGRAVFKKTCATCHRVQGEGAMIGPQLDGVGVRGVERLMEDVLDPNRNVDAAFRTTIVTTTSGQVISGLRLREEGQALILADQQGKEQRVALGEIDESRLSSLSLMPANVAETISEPDFYALVSFLLTLKMTPSAATTPAATPPR